MKQRLLRWAKRLLKVTLWLAIIIALFFGIENWRAKRAWAQHLEWLKSKGETLDLAAFAPPAVPDEDNAALAPVFDCFYTVDKQTGKRTWASILTDEIPQTLPDEQRQRLAAWWQLRVANLILQEIPKRTDGSWDFEAGFPKCRKKYEAYRKSKERNLPVLFPTESPSALENLSNFYAQFEPLLKGLREAGQHPFCVWPSSENSGFRYRNELSRTALMNDFILAFYQHDATRSQLASRAYRRLGSGRVAGEFSEDFRSKFRQKGTFTKGALWAVAARQWSEVEWAKIVQEVPQVSLRKDLADYLRLHRAYEIEHSPKRSLPDYASAALTHLSCKKDWRLFYGLGPSGWIYRNMISRHQAFQSQIELLSQETLTGFCNYAPPTKITPYDFALVGNDLWRRLLSDVVESNDKSQLASAAIALERFRLKTCAFPEQLAQVVPEFLPELPKSYFDDQTPHYERRPDGLFKLWFDGIDGDDDQGRARDEENRSAPKDDYDIVFSPPAPIP